jgi:hypothetical protein
MSNVIDFLERLGQDARLRQGLQDEVALAIAHAQIDPELRVAILAKDQQRIEALLGQGPLCCMLVPGKEGEEEEEEGEEIPSRDDEDAALSTAYSAVALLR